MSSFGVHRTVKTDRHWHSAHFKKHPDSTSKGIAKQRSNYTDSDNPSSYKAKKYCNACWEVDMQRLRDADAELVRQSPGRAPIPDSVHENALWNPQDLHCITRGDSKTMIHHLYQCPYVPDAIRQQAAIHKTQPSPHTTTSHSHNIPQPPYPSTAPMYSSPGAGPSSMGPPLSRAGTYPPSNYPSNEHLSLDYILHSQTPPPPSPSWSNLGPNDSVSQIGLRSVSVASGSRAETPASRPASRARSTRSQPVIGDVSLLQPWSPQRLHHFENLLGSITASAGLPLRWVDNQYWRRLCEEFMPMAPQIGRNTMRRCILPSLRNELKAKVRESVRNRNGTIQDIRKHL